jgi:hypothetical protein
MDRTSALAHLPEPYQRLFSMLDAGLPTPDISDALGVEEMSIPTLVRIGTDKLEALTGAATAGSVA